jgi:transposase
VNLLSYFRRKKKMSETNQESTVIHRVRVTDEQFVSCHKNCHSNAQVAQMLGISEATVAARANKLRKIGVRLPKFDRVVNSKEVDVEGLNALLAE